MALEIELGAEVASIAGVVVAVEVDGGGVAAAVAVGVVSRRRDLDDNLKDELLFLRFLSVATDWSLACSSSLLCSKVCALFLCKDNIGK